MISALTPLVDILREKMILSQQNKLIFSQFKTEWCLSKYIDNVWSFSINKAIFRKNLPYNV